MATKALNIKGNRIHWMDNLRTFIIFLVVLYHVGGVYEAAGLWGWFWIVDDPDTITWVGIIGLVIDIFVMPTLFFISGYLTPASLEKVTGWDFVKGKFKRLITHVIVIGIFATLLLNVDLPAVVKYLLLVVLTYVGSNLLVSGYRALVNALKTGRNKSTSQAWI